MKKQDIQQLIRGEEIKNHLTENKLIDKIYDALLTIPEFNQLGMDQHGEMCNDISRVFDRYLKAGD